MTRSNMNTSASQKWRWSVQGVMIYLFLASLWLPLLTMLWVRFGSGNQGGPLDPGQAVAPAPHIPRTLADLNDFPAKFDAFYEDRFGFRQSLVHLNGLVKVKGLGVSPDSRVVIGKEGWLFLGDWPIPENDTVIRQVRGLRLLSEDELESWKRGLEARRDWLEERGIRYVLVIVPHKHTIYPEYLPDHLSRVRDRTPADQLTEYLSADSDVPVLDLRAALKSKKDEEEIYRHVDTHWNIRGAWVGYEEIMRYLSGWFPDVGPLSRSDFEEDLVVAKPGDLARTVGLGGILREEIPRFLPTRVALFSKELPTVDLLDRLQGLRPDRLRVNERSLPRLPRAILVHDSFAYTLMPLLSEHFSRIVYLRRPSTRDFLDHNDRSAEYLEQLVDIERPAVVIDQLVERNLVWAYRDYETR